MPNTANTKDPKNQTDELANHCPLGENAYVALGFCREKIAAQQTTLEVCYPLIYRLPLEAVKQLHDSLRGKDQGQVDTPKQPNTQKDETFFAYTLDRHSLVQLEAILVKHSPAYGKYDDGLKIAMENLLSKQPTTTQQKSPLAFYSRVKPICAVLHEEQTAITSVEEGYLKLHLLSTCLARPHQLSLENLFSTLNNLAFTNFGPVLASDINALRPLLAVNAAQGGPVLRISHIDKFPYLTDYIAPHGVRIADASRVRLGAHLSPGTTVMPAGYVNFNAGTLGNAMIEGRVSAGVVIGDNSDVGGGASIMGTLSGGGEHVISIGKHCLLGANAGTGISLGFGCTIAAGTYVTSNAKLSLYDSEKKPVDLNGGPVCEGENVVYGRDISGRNHMLILQDSKTGQLKCMPNKRTISLNTALHAN